MFKSAPAFFVAAVALASGATACAAAANATAPVDLTPQAMAQVQQIEDFLQEQAASYPGTVQIRVEPPRTDKLAACDQSEAFFPSGSRIRSRLTVGIRCLAPSPWVSYTQASLSIQGKYYVSAHSINAGAILTMADLAEREGDLLRLANGIVHDSAQLVGFITTQRIGARTPIKASALRSPESIERGQAVRLEARGVGFVATSDGKAMQSGAPGKQIQVRTSSGQMVTGTVLNGSTVLVIL